jgi:hypothetical protein
LWDVMPCYDRSLLRFHRNVLPSSSGSRKPAKHQKFCICQCVACFEFGTKTESEPANMKNDNHWASLSLVGNKRFSCVWCVTHVILIILDTEMEELAVCWNFCQLALGTLGVGAPEFSNFIMYMSQFLQWFYVTNCNEFSVFALEQCSIEFHVHFSLWFQNLGHVLLILFEFCNINFRFLFEFCGFKCCKITVMWILRPAVSYKYWNVYILLKAFIF